jgi:hypothetical protein
MLPNGFDDDDDSIFLVGFDHGKRGLASFRIEHTARTWGADIEALLTTHLRTLLTTETGLKRTTRVHSGKIGAGTAVCIVLGGLLTTVFTANRFSMAQLEQAKAVLGTSSTHGAALPDQIAFAIHATVAGDWPRFQLKMLLFLFATLTISIALGVWAAAAADRADPSFVSLTKESFTRRKALMRKNTRQLWSFITSICVSVLTGVVGNIVFFYLWGGGQGTSP